jgi:hypothetical protein
MCASFHISVHEDNLPLVKNTGVWPQGALIAPFYGNLSVDQIYTSENRNSNRSYSPGDCDSLVPLSATSNSFDGTRGGGDTPPA